MRTRVVIQSRLSSSRLPGKALMTVAGYPLIELVARRAARTGFEVVVATSVEQYDDLIASHLARVGIPVVRGPLDDVLARFVDATADLDPDDTVVRLTGDNPVADADLVQELIDAMARDGHVYGRVDIDQVPEGLGAEVFSVRVLRQAAESATEAYDHEHVTPWIRRHCGELLFAPADNPGDPAAYRCTTDCLHDYDRIARLFSRVDDPVTEPWSRIVGMLREEVDALGPRATPLQGGRGYSNVLISAKEVGMSEGERDMVVCRETFAGALDRGISHVYCCGDELAAIRAATLPALNKRLQHVVEIHPGSEAEAITVSRLVERAFADLGQRRLAGVVVPTSLSSQAWEEMERYHASGEVAEIGVRISEADQLDAIPGSATLVVLPGHLARHPIVARLHADGVIVVALEAQPSPGHAVVVEPRETEQLVARLGELLASSASLA